MIKLYGHPFSTFTQRVATILNEKNVPFEYIKIDLTKGEHKQEPHVSRQPFGVVPVIDDDGFILYESAAICWYIATKYRDQGTPLLPEDLKEQAIAHQAMATASTSFDVFASPIVYERRIKPMLGEEPDNNWAERHRASLAERLDVYEKILSKQKYLAGDKLTLADLYHLPYGVLLPTVGCHEIEERPAVSKWFNELTERPSWKALDAGIVSTAQGS